MASDPTPAPPVVPKPEVDATPQALAHAASLGVDLTQIKGTGVDGRILKGDVEAAVAAHEAAEPTELELVAAPGQQAYFCLEANHPGQSTPRADHFDMRRMFYSSAKGAPICPLCRKQVSAIPVDDTSKLPPSLQATAERLAVAERQR